MELGVFGYIYAINFQTRFSWKLSLWWKNPIFPSCSFTGNRIPPVWHVIRLHPVCKAKQSCLINILISRRTTEYYGCLKKKGKFASCAAFAGNLSHRTGTRLPCSFSLDVYLSVEKRESRTVIRQLQVCLQTHDLERSTALTINSQGSPKHLDRAGI